MALFLICLIHFSKRSVWWAAAYSSFIHLIWSFLCRTEKYKRAFFIQRIEEARKHIFVALGSCRLFSDVTDLFEAYNIFWCKNKQANVNNIIRFLPLPLEDSTCNLTSWRWLCFSLPGHLPPHWISTPNDWEGKIRQGDLMNGFWTCATLLVVGHVIRSMSRLPSLINYPMILEHCLIDLVLFTWKNGNLLIVAWQTIEAIAGGLVRLQQRMA